MTSHDPSIDPQDDASELDQLSNELSASIDRCRSLLDDCRSRLSAANSNEPGGEELDRSEA